MKLFIQNMLSLQSLLVVRNELLRLGLEPVEIAIGEVDVLQDISDVQELTLRISLRQSGLVLLENEEDILVHRIKYLIVDTAYMEEGRPMQNFTLQLSAALDLDYTYLSNLFFDMTGGSIEQCYIFHKIGRVKKLLIYEGLSLGEIAVRMRYRSVIYLHNQFRKVTGMTPDQFKAADNWTHRLVDDDMNV